jgi:hypothetical protein
VGTYHTAVLDSDLSLATYQMAVAIHHYCHEAQWCEVRKIYSHIIVFMQKIIGVPYSSSWDNVIQFCYHRVGNLYHYTPHYDVLIVRPWGEEQRQDISHMIEITLNQTRKSACGLALESQRRRDQIQFCCDELPVPFIQESHMLIQLYLPLATMIVCVIWHRTKQEEPACEGYLDNTSLYDVIH